MRVLLDEDIPVGFRRYFRSDVEVETVEYRGCVTGAVWNLPLRSPGCLSVGGVRSHLTASDGFKGRHIDIA